MPRRITKIKNFILDTLFPIQCLDCGKEGEWICKACLSTIKLNKTQHCPKCGKDSEEGKFCQKCSPKSKLFGILICANYENKLLQKAIHLMKYRFVKEMAEPLSLILIKQLKKSSLLKTDKNLILIPVPLYKKRQRQRGFNQASLLASYLSKKMGLHFEENSLTRIKNTKSQMKLNSLQRRKNIKNAFSCIKHKAIRGKTVVLVDDVCTTSSTLEECAKALDQAQPKEIWGLVLARGG